MIADQKRISILDHPKSMARFISNCEYAVSILFIVTIPYPNASKLKSSPTAITAPNIITTIEKITPLVGFLFK